MAIKLDPMPQVWGITGNLGGGKSLTAVNLAVTSMLQGYFVASNIWLNLDAICRDYGDWMRDLYLHFNFDYDFDASALPTGSPRGTRGGKRVLVILDECAEWLDQYTSMSDPRVKNFFSWLRHSSKRSQDVVLIVQRLDYLNKNLRILVSKWLIVDDLSTYRLPVLKCRCWGFFGFCMQRVFDRQKRLIQGPCIVRKSKWGRYYDTAQCLSENVASQNWQYRIPAVYDSPWKYLFVASFIAFVSLVIVSQIKRQKSPNLYELLGLENVSPEFLLQSHQTNEKRSVSVPFSTHTKYRPTP